MMVLQISGVILMIIGIVCMLYGIFIFTRSKPVQEDDYLEKSILSSIGNKTEEIDKTIDEFDKVSGEVLTQLDEKYNELLFLYSLIDDKKSEMAGLSEREPQITKKLSEFQELSQGTSDGKKFKNVKHDEVKRLIEQGISVADTAKTLNIGQGEVRLILELGKM
ncbi:MAG: hypothetical protein FWE29_04155 [Defluviitaleaceae bacterium]|nr:hypothetical protein [Defluviitaleaceae bacterium]